ncbi:MAG TPA: glycosyltransferase 87 family protein [Thermoanaerobaculia bacterium]|nr:glycosyltransferase 87 family protein [Thermoanaerobaculia bacterium]
MSWRRHPLAAAAPLVLAAAALLWLHDLEARPWATLAVLTAAVAAFAHAIVRLRGTTLGAPLLVLVALALRLCLLPLPPTLSDDVYRYLWDGRVAAAGRNPYFHSPDDTDLAPLRDVMWERVGHREVETVYPPFAIAAFSIAARLPRPLLAWKAMLTTVDLLSCLLLLWLARARGVPTGRCVAYAWNPLVVLEVAGMAHVDALGVAPLLAAALLLVEHRGETPPLAREEASRAPFPYGPTGLRRGLAAGALLGLAILAKLVPLLVLPAWTRASLRRALFVLGALGLVALATVPFALGAPGPPPGLVTYAVSWEFNGPLFEPLWRVLDAAGAAPWLKARIDGLKEATGRHDAWNRVYPFVYPQLLAKALLALALVAVTAASLRRADPVEAAFLVFAGMLLLSATVYPWYALWVLPWAALLWRVPWLILSSSLFLAYLPRLLDVPLLPWPFLLVWCPFLIGLWWARSRATG